METKPQISSQDKKLEEMIRRKHEIDKKKQFPEQTPEIDEEAYRYQEIIRSNKRKGTAKERVFNNAFCVEIKEEEERVIQKMRDPQHRPTLVSTKYEQVLEKERKIKLEEARISQDRLKMIDKRTKYSELLREIMSPVTRAKLSPDLPTLPRSSSKHELHRNDDCAKLSERSKLTDPGLNVRNLKARSNSRKELSPMASRQTTGRSPMPRQTLVSVKGNLS